MLITGNPQLAFARALSVLCPAGQPAPGIDPRASVDTASEIGRDVHVGPFAIIEAGAYVGDGAVIHGGVYIGEGASIGAASILYPGVAVRERCTVGRRVIIHCNAVIGADGFGYAHDGADYVKIPQIGTVRVEDDVEIGASTTIDRAALGETIIGRGTKIDNLVQIAHNVKIGEGGAIAAQAGVAGSATIGRQVQLGGQAGVAGHITIGDGLVAAARTGLHGNTAGGQIVSGFPSMPIKDWRKSQVMLMRLPELREKVRELEARIKELEGKKD
jgi:UDP-3-O-[3-hydroxymyristoyl] glucosamine N-acyltransferase